MSRIPSLKEAANEDLRAARAASTRDDRPGKDSLIEARGKGYGAGRKTVLTGEKGNANPTAQVSGKQSPEITKPGKESSLGGPLNKAEGVNIEDFNNPKAVKLPGQTVHGYSVGKDGSIHRGR